MSNLIEIKPRQGGKTAKNFIVIDESTSFIAKAKKTPIAWRLRALRAIRSKALSESGLTPPDNLVAINRDKDANQS